MLSLDAISASIDFGSTFSVHCLFITKASTSVLHRLDEYNDGELVVFTRKTFLDGTINVI